MKKLFSIGIFSYEIGMAKTVVSTQQNIGTNLSFLAFQLERLHTAHLKRTSILQRYRTSSPLIFDFIQSTQVISYVM